MINNLEKILSYLKFPDEKSFYIVHIICRKKDSVNGQYITTFYIRSQEELINQFSIITKICDAVNARAYILLDVKNTDKLLLQTSENLGKILNSNNYSTRRVFGLIAGAANDVRVDKRKLGMLDIDNKNISVDDFPSNFLCIPTVSGLHVVASRKELREFLFTKNLDVVDIYKKEPLILLYYNNECKNTNS